MKSLRRFRPFPRPRLGHRLPSELRAGRVGRLAGALPDGVLDPGFETLLRRIDGSPIHRGNRVEVFTRGADAFGAMCTALLGAREEILLESYILRDDATGRSFLEMLAGATRRGVQVRVLADAAGSFGTRRAFWREMAAHGIEVRLFHPLAKGLWNQVFRDHRKILVVDRRIGFTGGMNIGREYGSMPWSKPHKTWRDTHVRIEGPAAWEMAVVFAEGWRRADGKPFDLPDLVAGPDAPPGAGILVLDSRPMRGHVESASVLAAIAGAARRTLWITNAYFAPGHAALKVLGAAARRGVDVRLLLPGATDAPIVRHAGHGFYSALLASGVRVFEYQAAVLHAKSLVADDYVAVVGSSNLDFRSFYFNAECNLVILDQAAAEALAVAFRTDLEQSNEIERAPWRARPPLHRLGDRLARQLAPLL